MRENNRRVSSLKHTNKFTLLVTHSNLHTMQIAHAVRFHVKPLFPRSASLEWIAGWVKC